MRQRKLIGLLAGVTLILPGITSAAEVYRLGLSTSSCRTRQAVAPILSADCLAKN